MSNRSSQDFALEKIQNFNEDYGDDAYDSIFRDEVTSLRGPEIVTEKRFNNKMIITVFALTIICLALITGGDLGRETPGKDRYPPDHESPYQSNLRPYGNELTDGNEDSAKLLVKEGEDNSEKGQNPPDSKSIYESNLRPYGSELINGNESNDEQPTEEGENSVAEEHTMDDLESANDGEISGEEAKIEEVSALNASTEDLKEEKKENDQNEKHDNRGFFDKLFGKDSPSLSEDDRPIEEEKDTGELEKFGPYYGNEENENIVEDEDVQDEYQTHGDSGDQSSSHKGDDEETELGAKEKDDTQYPEYLVEKKKDPMLDFDITNPLLSPSTSVDHTHDVYDPFHKNKGTPVQKEEGISAEIENQNSQSPTVPPLSEDDVTDTIQPFRSLQYKFADIEKPFVPGIDVPFFWYIPRSAGTSIESMLTKCHGMVGAGNKGAIGGAAIKPYLEVYEPFPGENFVNVGLRTPKGIQRAIDLDIIGSGLVDVVFASRLYQVKDIFHPPKNQGRCFTLFRHPVERAVSLFYYLKDASHENSFNEELSTMSIDDYVASSKVESDWMVRSLVGKLDGGRVTEDDLFHATKFIESKCLIGLTSKLRESYKRFENYFELSSSNNVNCENKVMGELALQAKSHPKLDFKSETWNKLEERNQFDLKLYNYALRLFEEQGRIAR